MTTHYDTGRAHIDELLTSGNKPEALSVAIRLFPQQRRILSAAIERNDEELFREICAIPSGSAWVDGQYLPGKFIGFQDTGIPDVEVLNSAPVPAPANAPAPLPPVMSAADMARGFVPAFVFVLCTGTLVIVIIFFVVVAGSILSGLAAGLATAMQLIGEILGYLVAIAAVVIAVVYYIRYHLSSSAAADEYEEYTTAPRTGQHRSHDGINVVVNIHSPHNNQKS